MGEGGGGEEMDYEMFLDWRLGAWFIYLVSMVVGDGAFLVVILYLYKC